MSASARGLKNLSGELGVPVLALVQLNRNRANRPDKRPQLADLRESGELENTADSVLGLYHDGRRSVLIISADHDVRLKPAR